jgi:hypothetical protein
VAHQVRYVGVVFDSKDRAVHKAILVVQADKLVGYTRTLL